MRKRVAEGGLLASLLLSGCSGPLSTLDPAGPYAAEVAWLWWGMLLVATLVAGVVSWLWWYGMRRDGSKSSQQQAQGAQHRWVIWGGIALPTVAITVLLAFGIPVGHRMLPLSGDKVLTIEINAKQWFWEVYYPDSGIRLIDEVHIPVDTPVNFHVRSDDVIHSFWVPRLGGKIDAIPGKLNRLRLQASQTGTFAGQCAEYCGQGHAFMQFKVTAHEAEAFQRWQQSHAAADAQEEGVEP